MENLVEKVKKNIASKNQRFPCYVNRASSIGYFVPELNGCVRKGVYERTNWQEKELYDSNVLLIFAEGNNQERQVLKDLADAGVDIIEQQSAFEWKEYQISGHLDGVYIEEGKAIPVEIKSMSPFIFDSIHCFEDFKKKPWTRAYMAQIMIYMLFKNIDKGIFILKDKSTGNLKQIDVNLDYELAENCIKTAEKINKHIKENTLPEKIKDIETCKDCKFKLICCPDINFGAPLKIIDDPDFENKITKSLELKESSNEYDKLWKSITDKAKASVVNGELNQLVGKYRVYGKLSSKGSFTTKIDVI
jgi:CRISPR/Cas system-associated exonuclease Cas4 (RecB family)